MLALTNKSKSKRLQRLEDARLRSIDGELSHYAAIPVSTTKASSTGDSSSNTSAPKVST
jgi:hypothetical protein